VAACVIPGVTVVVTVRDEEDSIHGLLGSLADQTRPPDEIIVCDGGSSDSTVAILRSHLKKKELPLSVIERPAANISQGRNAAISEAQCPIIAVTDAGVRLAPEWLAALVDPFEQDSKTQVVSGFFLPDPRSIFEVALSATTLPALGDVDPDTFLPSSRSVAFRRKAWETVGGYPEWIDYCEDLLFDLALRKRYGHFAFAPMAVAHFRPRNALGAFFRQYYRYARGDGKADLWRMRHLVRYMTYLLIAPFLVLMTLRYTPVWLLAFLIGSTVMLYTPYRRLYAAVSGPQSHLSLGATLLAIAWVPVVRLTGDVAKMLGYPAGRLWRRRHRQWIPASVPRG
jgi:glycosyltransferase involved in cell wall biosynthesis